MPAEPTDAYARQVAQDIADAIATHIAPLLGEPPLYTLPQVASKLNIRLRKLEYMVADGRIASVKVEGARRIEQAELERYIAAQRMGGEA